MTEENKFHQIVKYFVKQKIQLCLSKNIILINYNILFTYKFSVVKHF